MRILWFTWKDLQHPLAGGAEVINEELAKRLAAEGHKVTFIVGGFKGGATEEAVNGYKIIRLGNRYTLYWFAYRYYKKRLQGGTDLIIDEVNTIPFLTKLYVKEPNFLFVHQLAREIWFFQMIFPLSLIGYLLEPLYLRLLNDRKVITVSKSTKNDLMKYGFKDHNISIISEGIDLEPIQDLATIKKYKQTTLLSFGAIRPMKRTHHQIKAFELAKQQLPDLRLKVAGDATGSYGQKVLNMIAKSPYVDSIEYLGRVSKDQKIELMQKSHAILVTSVKEGWGLIVTEAASQGTSALVYDVDGLRDSVEHNQTGLITKINNPAALAHEIMSLCKDKRKSVNISDKAWQSSKKITFDQSFRQFKQVIDIE